MLYSCHLISALFCTPENRALDVMCSAGQCVFYYLTPSGIYSEREVALFHLSPQWEQMSRLPSHNNKS